MAAGSRPRRRLPDSGPARGSGRGARLPPAGRLRPLLLPHHPRPRDARLSARELDGRGDGRLQRNDRDPRARGNRSLRALLLRDRRGPGRHHRHHRLSPEVAVRTVAGRGRPERRTAPVLRLQDEPSQGPGVRDQRRGRGPRRRAVRPPPGHRHPSGDGIPAVRGTRDLDRGRRADKPRGTGPGGGRHRFSRLGAARCIPLLGGRGRARLRHRGPPMAGRGGGWVPAVGPNDPRIGQAGETSARARHRPACAGREAEPGAPIRGGRRVGRIGGDPQGSQLRDRRTGDSLSDRAERRGQDLGPECAHRKAAPRGRRYPVGGEVGGRRDGLRDGRARDRTEVSGPVDLSRAHHRPERRHRSVGESAPAGRAPSG